MGTLIVAVTAKAPGGIRPVMRGRAGLRAGRAGIGGFMEAVLAMMVVICGVMLVTMSLAFVGIDLRRNSGEAALQDGSMDLTRQLFSLSAPFFEGEVLQNSSLPLLSPSFFHVGAQVKGYCITLQDITAGSASVVLLRAGEMTTNDTRSVSTPVLLFVEDRTVHAAKATVIVWR